MTEIMIQFGALAEPVEKQLNKQGFTLGDKITIDHYDAMFNGLVEAHIDRIISEKEYEKILERYMKQIKKEVKLLKEGE